MSDAEFGSLLPYNALGIEPAEIIDDIEYFRVQDVEKLQTHLQEKSEMSLNTSTKAGTVRQWNNLVNGIMARTGKTKRQAAALAARQNPGLHACFVARTQVTDAAGMAALGQVERTLRVGKKDKDDEQADEFEKKVKKETDEADGDDDEEEEQEEKAKARKRAVAAIARRFPTLHASYLRSTSRRTNR